MANRLLLASVIIFGIIAIIISINSYYNNIIDGRVKFEKDLEHTIGYTALDPEKQHAISSLTGKWVGIKFKSCRKDLDWPGKADRSKSPGGAIII
jgi:hypothetical protein